MKKSGKTIIHLLSILICLLLVTSCKIQEVTSDFSENNKTGENVFILNDSDEKQTEEAVVNPDFTSEITMEGGTGKAYIYSPVSIHFENEKYHVTLVWNSKNYDYMIVDGKKYLNENEGGESTFTVELNSIDEPVTVLADTVAMSKPHEIEYVIYFDGDDSNTHTGDAKDEQNLSEASEEETAVNSADFVISDKTPKELCKLGFEAKPVKLEYANEFTITEYGDYTYIVIKGDGDYLVVPEGKEVPKGINSETVVLKQPLDKTYLVSTSCMDLIRECGALNNIRLSGTDSKDWYIEEARQAFAAGSIVYAGKYSAPDFELILQEGCNFAIENTMIYHKPEVKEMLEQMGIPVMVEHSSYENHPLGRLEWIKLYDRLYSTDRGSRFFDEQIKELQPLLEHEKTGKKVAFFYVSGNGLINVRQSDDYVAKMIELAGGEYAIKSGTMDKSSHVATANMQMEDFYVYAKDADILIYNSTIGGAIESVEELIEKNAMFAEFDAVKSGEVYCTTSDFFQETTGAAHFISDMNAVLNGKTDGLKYLKKVGN